MIFYDKKRAEEILENGFSSFMSFEELFILAKYFRDEEGENDREIKDSLNDFCARHQSGFNEVLSRKKIASAIRSSKKNKLRTDIEININKKELDSIKMLKSHNLQKILFVMLSIAKYLKANYIPKNKDKEDNNKYYVYSYNFIKILKMAKVNVSKHKRKLLLYELEQSGFITTYPNGYFEVNIACDDSDTIITLNSLDDIIDHYVITCDACGKILDNVSKMHCMCTECYKKKRLEDVNKNVKKHTEKVKMLNNSMY